MPYLRELPTSSNPFEKGITKPIILFFTKMCSHGQWIPVLISMVKPGDRPLLVDYLKCFYHYFNN